MKIKQDINYIYVFYLIHPVETISAVLCVFFAFFAVSHSFTFYPFLKVITAISGGQKSLIGIPLVPTPRLV